MPYKCSRMKIGELSAQTGVSVATLRYYTDEGLIQSQRTQSGYRDFDNTAVAAVRRIRVFRALGLSLPEIGRLLAFSRSPVESCSEVCGLMRGHLEHLLFQQQALKEAELEIRRLIESCAGTGQGCKILESFQTS